MPLILLSHVIRAALSVATVYTPTHYVAPFASVAGATNDYDDLGATAWTNAATSGTPTTLGTAMARAVAGNKVRCAAGVYAKLWNGDGTIGFKTTNSGTSGNPIVFYAATPAATNRGSPGLFSELRWSGSYPTIVAGGGEGIIGSNLQGGGNYVVIDGFFARATYAPPYSSQGALVAGVTGIEFRRIYYDYETTTPTGDNYNAFWIRGSVDCKILDCYITGGYGSGARNASCITPYYAQNFLIQNNYFYNVNSGVFVKVADAQPQYGRICYNRFEQVSLAALHVKEASAAGVEIDHNLIIDSNFLQVIHPGIAGESNTFNVHNNTVSNGSTTGSQALIMNAFDSITDTLGSSQFYNNLMVDRAGGTVSFFWSPFDTETFESHFVRYTLFDYNVYYDANGPAQFDDGPTVDLAGFVAQLGAWQESHSLNVTVTFSGADDYRLLANGQGALTASDVGGPVGAYVTGSEEIGIRSNPVY